MLNQLNNNNRFFDTKSLSGALWEWRGKNIQKCETDFTHCSSEEIPPFLLDLILSRGVSSNSIENFISPSLKNSIGNPLALLDMDKATERLFVAINKKEKIAVLADYDVDGATSAALLKNYLDEIGMESIVYIPDRIQEGYGPNTTAMLGLKKDGYTLCFTLDCGTLAHEPISQAKKSGMDVIIIDHHMSSQILPEAIATINPNRYDEQSKYKNIAAVGVTFLFLIAMNKKLRENNFFSTRKEPNLFMDIDLIAVGTVCDMMQLTELNRTFVAQGLKKLNNKYLNLGLKHLINKYKATTSVTTYTIGFNIGPCINAGGRIGNSNLGVRLLTTKNPKEAEEIAEQLFLLNEERKDIQNIAISEAMIQAEIQALRNERFIVVSGDWHPGIIGILASQIKDKFYLPTIVISLQGDTPKASARSVTSVDMGSLVLKAKAQKIVIEGGGHKAAAGFSIKQNDIPRMHQFMKDSIKDIIIQKINKFDAIIDLDIINENMRTSIEKISPFGMGNPTPVFATTNSKIVKTYLIKDKHLSCEIKTNTTSIPAICFNAKQRGINIDSIKSAKQIKAIFFTITKHYKNNSTQLNIEDIIL